jgi:hypothetical protein
VTPEEHVIDDLKRQVKNLLGVVDGLGEASSQEAVNCYSATIAAAKAAIGEKEEAPARPKRWSVRLLKSWVTRLRHEAELDLIVEAETADEAQQLAERGLALAQEGEGPISDIADYDEWDDGDGEGTVMATDDEEGPSIDPNVPITAVTYYDDDDPLRASDF